MSILDLLYVVGRPPDVSIDVPKPAKWLSSNQRGAWQAHHREVAAWRIAGGWAARGRPCMSRAYAVAELRFRDRRKRDAPNWWPTVKAVIDGFVDVEVFPDDNSGVLIGPDMRIGPVGTREQLIVHLWEIT